MSEQPIHLMYLIDLMYLLLLCILCIVPMSSYWASDKCNWYCIQDLSLLFTNHHDTFLFTWFTADYNLYFTGKCTVNVQDT